MKWLVIFLYKSKIVQVLGRFFRIFPLQTCQIEPFDKKVQVLPAIFNTLLLQFVFKAFIILPAAVSMFSLLVARLILMQPAYSSPPNHAP